MNLAARYSNGVIPRVCPLVHALVQCNPQRAHAYPDPQDKFHDRFGKRKKRGEKKEKKKRTGGEAGMEVVSRVGKLNLGKGAGDTVARTTSGAKFDRAKLEAHVRVSLAPRVHVRCDESRFSYGAKTSCSSSHSPSFLLWKICCQVRFSENSIPPCSNFAPTNMQIHTRVWITRVSLNLFSRIVVVIKDQVRYALEKSNWGR